MASLFFMPFRPAYDSNGRFIPGAQLWFTESGTNVPISIYTDDALTTPQPNPAVANAVGRWDPIFWDNSEDIRVRVYDADATVGVDTPLEDYDPYTDVTADLSLRGELAAEDGAELIGAPGGGTVSSKLFGGDRGTVQSGATNDLLADRSFTGAADGTTQFYGVVNRVYAEGANNIDHARAMYVGAKSETTAGSIANLHGIHAFTWVGGAGNVAAARVFEGHLVADSTGNITTDAIIYNIAGTTLSSTATVDRIYGFNCGEIGHATKVNRSYCFNGRDQIASVEASVSFHSEMTANAKKWAFYAPGGAQSAFSGFVGIGMTVAPSWQLELRSTANNYAASFANSHASGPFGLRIIYTGAAPNNSDQYFINCSDTVQSRFRVTSSGTVHTNGLQVVGNRATGWAAATGTATRTTFATGSVTTAQLAERVKALIDDLTSHGLIGA